MLVLDFGQKIRTSEDEAQMRNIKNVAINFVVVASTAVMLKGACLDWLGGPKRCASLSEVPRKV
eukprot:1183342-Amphidinium_carterae.1